MRVLTVFGDGFIMWGAFLNDDICAVPKIDRHFGPLLHGVLKSYLQTIYVSERILLVKHG